jgi:hypothetical protein
MLRKILFAPLAVALATLLLPSLAHAWGAYHAGYTHVGPTGVQHVGYTTTSGGGSAYHSGYTTTSGGGSAYHAGYTTTGGGSAYHAGYTTGGSAYHYSPSYSGAAYGGVHVEGAYVR